MAKTDQYAKGATSYEGKGYEGTLKLRTTRALE